MNCVLTAFKKSSSALSCSFPEKNCFWFAGFHFKSSSNMIKMKKFVFDLVHKVVVAAWLLFILI